MDNLSFLENKPLNENNISVLSIPLDVGSDNSDMSDGPEYLLKLGLKEALQQSGFMVDVLPRIPASKKDIFRKDSLRHISKVIGNTKNIVKQKISGGAKVLAIGGDHTISIGTIAGALDALKGDLGVIWIDAHADINTHKTSITGNVHGMVVSSLMGIGDKMLTNQVKNKIKKENILYIGLKDLDQAEIDLIRSKKISAITMMDILQKGFSSVTGRIALLNKKVSNIWVSLDIDVVDQQFSPACAMPTPGGLSYREITNMLTYIGKTCNVAGMDLVEITPKKDINNKTGKLCIELIVSAFGSAYNWYSQYINFYKKNNK